MRIGINAVFLGDHPTGVGVFTRQIARFIGQSVEHELCAYTSAVIEGLRRDMLHVTPARARGSAFVLDNLFRFAYINLALPGVCRRTAVDVIYSPITEYPHLGSVPQVVHVHDFHPLDFPAEFGLAGPRFRWELGRLRNLRGRVTVSSGYVRDRLLDGNFVESDRVDVVPLGYDRSAFFPSDPSRRGELEKMGVSGPYILYVGSLLPYKNLKVVLEAFARIAPEVPHTLVVAGGGAHHAIEPTRDTGRIIKITQVSREELRDLYSFADLVVYPSLSEGFGLVPLEAMACGAPVVASARGAIPEVVGDAAVLFDPTDQDGLAVAVRSLLDDEERRGILSSSGRERCGEFSWERTATGIIQACERAVGTA